MDDQTGSQWDVPVEEHKCDFTPDCDVMGFLQLCADRRFHRCLMKRFQDDAKLDSPEKYWIHADAGGTPAMAHLTAAPDYCYYTKGVKVMGWAAHGGGCGGFPNTGDDEIRRELVRVAQAKAAIYTKASHFVYFATTREEEMVVYCVKYDKTVD